MIIYIYILQILCFIYKFFNNKNMNINNNLNML